MELRETLELILERLKLFGLDVPELRFEPPASLDKIIELEYDLGLELPPAFRRSLLSISSHVEFRWFTPDEYDFPPPFDEIFCGDLHWSLDLTRTFNQGWNESLLSLFPDRSNPYDAVWYDKLAFYEVGNGDYLAIDLSPENYEQIVYLSHDGSDLNGYILAKDFNDLLARWVPLACPGGEDWQWKVFTNSETTYIDPNEGNALMWRKLLNL
ncbi:MAG: SMI1/KNR4 family protein [Acidobacteria bacterium]|nr:SMI1/KNR4 family protein [Acidobacteriota bacterium]